jgi:hypothetical protein
MLGVSKNSILGRARRLKLPMHSNANIQSVRARVTNQNREQNREICETLRKWAYAPRAKGCQYITGDPRNGGTMCGAPIKRGSRFSFCDEHHKVCFRKPAAETIDEFLLQKWG